MLDSRGKPESGILEGNLKWTGRYYECINAQATQFKPKYCSVSVQKPRPPSEVSNVVARKLKKEEKDMNCGSYEYSVVYRKAIDLSSNNVCSFLTKRRSQEGRGHSAMPPFNKSAAGGQYSRQLGRL